MMTLLIRITLTALAVGIVGFVGYIFYLGLCQFFHKKNKHVMNADHRKQRGRTAPNRALHGSDKKMSNGYRHYHNHKYRNHK